MNKAILSILIILVAALFRFYGSNWDQGYSLHPDERFLLMVANDSHLPTSLEKYLDPNLSTLNPYNNKFSFFVYGTFPVNLNKYLVNILNMDNYENLRLFGRALSAIFDLGTLAALFFIVYQLEIICKLTSNIKYLSCFYYAIAVLPIQQSHFFTVDSFQTCGVFLSVCFALFSYTFSSCIGPILSGVFFGLALGCKISAIYILPLIGALLFFNRFYNPLKISYFYLNGIANCLIFLLASYLSLRFCDPKFFADANFLNPSLNPQFLKNLIEVNNLSQYTPWPYPPAVQWLSSKPYITPLKNLVFYGIGFPYAIMLILGVFYAFRKKHYLVIISVLWTIAIFIFQGGRFVHSMRYFFLLFPFFALYAALGTNKFVESKKLFFTIIIATVIWPLSYLNIYKQKHSRVLASEWIYENIDSDAVLAVEHWDDGLPLSMSKYKKNYKHVQLPVFGQDDENKWIEMNKALSKADYIIFSSNRGYGSLMPLRNQIPQTVKWYEDLFNGKSNFKIVKEISSLPRINFGFWQLQYDTQKAEEAFSVYDHPKVTIFKKIAP